METDWATLAATIAGIILTLIQSVAYVFFKRVSKSSCCGGKLEMSDKDVDQPEQTLAQLTKQLEELTKVIKPEEKKT